MDANTFKIANNYREVVTINDDENTDVLTDDASKTCQDCTFSMFTKANRPNELMCLQANIPVHVNGVCNLYVPVI